MSQMSLITIGEMTQRTLDIIYICKNPSHKYWDNANSYTDAVKNYMVNECGFIAKWYSNRQVLEIMWTVMMEYLAHCDTPGSFIWQLNNTIGAALASQQVRDDNGNYVNGFDDRIYKLDKEELK